MDLNHVNLPVDDVPAASAFLERHFGLRPAGPAHQNFAMLLDDHGFTLTLMGVGKSNRVDYPRTFHIGFIRSSEAEVDELNQALAKDEFEVEEASRRHGAWSFTFEAPGGSGEVPPHWWGPIAIWDGGLRIWGGIALGALVGIWRLRRAGVPVAPFMDAVAPALLVAQAIGRIGNYFRQELYAPRVCPGRSSSHPPTGRPATRPSRPSCRPSSS